MTVDENKLKSVLNEALGPLREDIKDLKEGVNILKNDVGVLKASVISIEQTMTSYADMYKINQKNIERLDDRVIDTEEKLGIQPLDELKIQHFS